MTTLRLAALRPGIPAIFATLQGEGPRIGRPSTFIRVSGCNLHCVWCDTPYTWNWQGTRFVHRESKKYDRQMETVTMEVGEVANAARARAPRAIVLTGGEPLAVQADLGALVALLPEFIVDIETNGTVAPAGPLAEAVSTWVVSPKLANSGMPEKLRIRPDVLRAFAQDPRAWFKWVVQGEEDLAEVEALVGALDLPPARVVLMPEGTEAAHLRASGPRVAAWALARNWCFSDRLHVTLYGGARDG